jgi:hypothetical protein
MLDNTPKSIQEKYGVPFFNGLPYRGVSFDLKKEDTKQPVLLREVHLKLLDTNNADDILFWQNVCQKVADGISEISFEEKKYNEATQSWLILLRWIDFYYTNP